MCKFKHFQGRGGTLYFNDFAQLAFRLITASSSIELIDQNSASVTHRAVKLVYVAKFKHLRVD